jgi:acetyltransferase-like isoleucine patch superfamily enzyme
MSAILHEDAHQIVFAIDPQFRKALERYKIFCHLFGDKVTVPKSARISPYTQFNICSALHTMGVGSYTMGPTSQIEVGAYCSLAGGLIVLGERHPIEDTTSSVVLYDHGKPHFQALYRDHQIKQERFSPEVPAYGAPPVIENDVWVGQNVILGRGITIGTGSVIAGGALVAKDVEPYTVVGGNPARVIRKRFSDKTCERLLASQWWTVDPADLLQWLSLRDPDIFLDQFKMVRAAGNLRRHSFAPATADILAACVRDTSAAA